MLKLFRPSLPKPVFIIGSYRSATSALTWALGQHPNILPLEETHFLYKLAVDLQYVYEIGTLQGEHSFLGLAKFTPRQFREHFGRACHELVVDARKRIERHSFEAACKDPSRVSANVKLKAGWRYPKRRWVDGTPENSHYVLPLLQMFPEAKFIHILRNPRRVAVSLMHFSSMGGHDYTERHAYETWTSLVRASALSEQALGSGKVLRLMHDDLLSSPRDALTRCLAFIEEKYDGDCLMPLREKMNSSRHDDAGDCSIGANIDSPSPWVREAFSLYRQLINGQPATEGDSAAAQRELKRSLDSYAESLRPDVNQSLTRINQALKMERHSLWQRLKRYELPLKVLDWGPQDIVAGTSFNLQEDGSSALWFSTQSAPEDTVVYLGGVLLKSDAHADGKLVTAIVPPELTAHPGLLAAELRSSWSAEPTPAIVVTVSGPAMDPALPYASSFSESAAKLEDTPSASHSMPDKHSLPSME